MRKHIFTKISLTVFALTTMFMFGGCDIFMENNKNDDKTNKLPTVQNIQVVSEMKKITWDSVNNATSYGISFNNKVDTISNNYYIVHDSLAVGSYEFKVIAKSNGEKYADSDEATKEVNVTKKSISALELENNTFSWTSDSELFVVTFNDTIETITNKNYTVDTSSLEAGTYTFTVQAKGDGGFILDSEVLTKELTVEAKQEKLGNVTNILVNNETREITWDSVVNATNYEITFNGITTTVSENTYTIDQSKIPTTKGNYEFKIIAKDNTSTYLDSESSSVNIEVKQEEITNLTCNDKTISWTSSYTSFEIEFNNNKQTINTNSYVVDTSLLETGDYVFTVKGIATNGFWIDSTNATYTFNYIKPQNPENSTKAIYKDVLDVLEAKIFDIIKDHVNKFVTISELKIQGINIKTGEVYYNYLRDTSPYNAKIIVTEFKTVNSYSEALEIANNLQLTTDDILKIKKVVHEEEGKKVIAHTMERKHVAELNGYTMKDIEFIKVPYFNKGISDIFIVMKDGTIVEYTLDVVGAQSDMTSLEEYINGAAYDIRDNKITKNAYQGLDRKFSKVTYKDVLDVLTPKLLKATRKINYLEDVIRVTIQGINLKTGEVYYVDEQGTDGYKNLNRYQAKVVINELKAVTSYSEALEIVNNINEIEVLNSKLALTNEECKQLVAHTMEKKHVAELNDYTMKDIEFIQVPFFDGRATNVSVVMKDGAIVEYRLNVVEAQSNETSLQAYINGKAYNIINNKITKSAYQGLDRKCSIVTYKDVEEALIPKIQAATKATTPAFLNVQITNVKIQGINKKTGTVYYSYLRNDDQYQATIQIDELTSTQSYLEALNIVNNLNLKKADIKNPTLALSEEDSISLVSHTMEKNQVEQMNGYTISNIDFIRATDFDKGSSKISVVMKDGSVVKYTLDVLGVPNEKALGEYIQGGAYNITSNEIKKDAYQGLDRKFSTVTYKDVEEALIPKIQAAAKVTPRDQINDVKIQGINKKTGTVYCSYLRNGDQYQATIQVDELTFTQSYSEALNVVNNLNLKRADIKNPTYSLSEEEAMSLVSHTMEKNQVEQMNGYTPSDIVLIRATKFSGNISNVSVVMKDGSVVKYTLDVVGAQSDQQALGEYIKGSAYNIPSKTIEKDAYQGLDKAF